MNPPLTQPQAVESPGKQPKNPDEAFVNDVRSQLSTLNGEVALRNRVIQTNDAYIYGDLLSRSLNIEVGHDLTPVNWLRRTCEIHRAQTIGEGFVVSSSYHGVDIDEAFDPDAKPYLELQNNKMKDHAEARNKIFQAILRDNGGFDLFAQLAENAAAIGTSVLKAWYDPDEGKYCLDIVEAVEHFYSMWSDNTFRKSTFDAYVYQVNPQDARKMYPNLPENMPTSPLGQPLAVLTSANTVEYISTQPMVTIMEINGKVKGWGTDGHGNLKKVDMGKENPINIISVANSVQQVIDDEKYMPHYYRFLNKKMRRRPWGNPSISDSAININQTYIQTLSDWRTVQSRINFPKYKAFGFGMDVQLPAPSPRKIEMVGLGEGQDIVPIQNPNSILGSEADFGRTIAELKEAFVREVGISLQLFDMPDANISDSNQAQLTAMKSMSDAVESRRRLWEPVIREVFEDALHTLALWEDSIKELVDPEEDWYLRIEWPPHMRKDDPVFVTNLINMFHAGLVSVQTLMERLGMNAKEEIDRMSDEMDNPMTAAIHGNMRALLAEFKIAGPPTSAPPKISVNLRGDLTPEQETNLSVMHQFGDGPIYGPTAGPQGELGIRATDDAVNSGRISGQGYNTGQPIISSPQSPENSQTPQPGGAPPMTPPTNNQPGQQPMSQPGSGAPGASPAGNVKKNNQNKGR